MLHNKVPCEMHLSGEKPARLFLRLNVEILSMCILEWRKQWGRSNTFLPHGFPKMCLVTFQNDFETNLNILTAGFRMLDK